MAVARDPTTALNLGETRLPETDATDLG